MHERLEKIKGWWRVVTTPYDEDLEAAIDTVCSACVRDGYCDSCPVSSMSQAAAVRRV